MGKYYLETFGCQMNVADSEMIEGILQSKGYYPIKRMDSADIIFVNTCAIREHAEEKVHSRLGVFSKIKNNKPNVIIGVLGCMAQHLKDDILDSKPYVDIILGPDSYRNLPKLMNRHMMEKDSIVDTKLSRYEVYEDLFPKRNKGINAWVSIMRGCDKFCSFCIVPFTRGRERSRSVESIVTEVKKAVDQGFVEITLLGQNVNSYKHENNSFAELLLAVSEVNGVERIRYTSPHPQDINVELLEVMASRKNICNYVHFPMQSGSNDILKRMNRTYTKEHFHYMADKIREIMPNCGLSTDIIVGFPGETDKDFEDTMNFIEKVKFVIAYSIIYSPRPGTPAGQMEDQIEEKIKSERLSRLQDEIKKSMYNFNKKFLNKNLPILVEKETSTNYFSGRSPYLQSVHFQSDNSCIGNIVEIKITKVNENSLSGEILQ